MIEYLNDLPPNMVGFRATGQVSANDFKEVLLPKVNDILAFTSKLNYLLVLDTALSNFTVGAWYMDLVLGIKYFCQWNRIAIVTDVDSIRRFTNLHTWFMPGKYKGFEMKDIQLAIDWVSDKEQ
jgi:SpoIIAA-like